VFGKRVQRVQWERATEMTASKNMERTAIGNDERKEKEEMKTRDLRRDRGQRGKSSPGVWCTLIKSDGHTRAKKKRTKKPELE